MTVEHLQPIPAPLYDPRHEHDACGVGFVAATDARHRARTVRLALEALANLAHRGARAADDTTGDGAGLSFALSPRFRRRIVAEAGAAVGPRRRVAIGTCFVPPTALDPACALVEETARTNGLAVAGWRDVPVDADLVADRRVGETPSVRQVVIVSHRRLPGLAFQRALAAVRRSVERTAAEVPALDGLTVASLSDTAVVYKGLFVGDELGAFYADLRADDLDAPYAIFHQRYSTNTFPSWRLSQPFRYLAHNGEINTVRGNRQRMRGRRHDLGGGRWARRLGACGPLVSEDGSDSASLDDGLELLVLAGMRVDEAIATLLPAAPGLGGGAGPVASRSEAWDGPAAIAFGDGRRVGAIIDRNGLRPLAMARTRDGLVVVSSEAGSVALDGAGVVARHRLGPGEMVVVDTGTGMVDGPRIPRGSEPITKGPGPAPMTADESPATGARHRVALGLDAEIVRQIVKPMATEGHEAIWSMGDDTPIAPLATRPRRVSAFLRQAFAQVTNPAIDPDRERTVLDLRMAIGRQPRLLDGGGAVVAVVPGPVLDARWWHTMRARLGDRRVVEIDATWPADRGARGLARALARIGRQAVAASRRGAALVVLTDRAVGQRRIAVPPVVAVGRANTELVDAGRRSRTDVAVEAGECFDAHDVAMLVAAGASAVHPWLLLELAGDHAGARGWEELDVEEARANTIGALEAGIRKVLARMGISMLAAYRGSQLFDAIGLDRALVERCFPAAGAWPGAVGVDAIGRQLLSRHRRAWSGDPPPLEDPGHVRYRASGEIHAFAPPVVKATQALAVRDGDADAIAAYREAVGDRRPRQPRDLLRLRSAPAAVPLAEVEPASRIVRRFVGSAMSLGALSPEAHQAISIGMARLGAAANSGEGGEDPAWYGPQPDGDRRDAAIKQVASARFGVTTEYLARADQLEIKIAQGSKPGEGGQLPGPKSTAFIAGLRRGQPGTTMISPPPHHDIYSIEDLAQLIADLRAVNPRARIGVKLVSAAGIGTIAAGVAKAHADYIMVSGHSGGTGASPLSSIKHAGLPWELGLASVHQVLVRNRLRDRVSLRTDGGLQTGRDVVVAALLGAEEFGFGTAALVAIGCDMARQCHLDTCPTGIATQRDDLRAKFAGTPEQVVAFFTAIAEDVRHELAALGVRTLGEIVGRADLLTGVPTPSALDLDPVLGGPGWEPRADVLSIPPKDRAARPDRAETGGFEAETAGAIVARIEAGEPITIRQRVGPRDRSIGARVAGALSRRPEPRQLPHVRYELTGSAGQSLGAFAVAGMWIGVTGEANDYVGKGLSGGTIVVRPPDTALADRPGALAGNVCLYGATGGVLHVVGRAGMRFAVRNSGARAVVEGIGAHGCEYMTGGTVVVLGDVGPNFGAGMTGGRAFVLDRPGLADRLNAESVAARPVNEGEARTLHELLATHSAEGSLAAVTILRAWDPARFVTVEPRVPAATVSPMRRPAERLASAR